MLKWFVMLMVVLGVLVGCATTKTVTLKSGTTLRAKTIKDTGSTYVVVEEKTGQQTVVPKGAVVSIK